MSDIRSLNNQFNHTMAKWKVQLERYSFSTLCAQPSPDNWSIGQVTLHLIEETHWYFEQIDVCLNTNANAEKEIRPKTEKWLKRNAYPNKKFRSPDDMPSPPMPNSEEALLRQWEQLNAEQLMTAMSIATSPFCGKVAHPRHGFLNAIEWFQYAEMHMRHHFRQKKRIDKYLNREQKRERETV